jgi:nitroreductase
MAICPNQAVQVPALAYDRDFFPLPAAPIDGSAFFSLLAARRSVRVFQDKPVPRELLEKVVQAIALAPPSFPPHNTELVVVQDTALIRRALPEMVAFYSNLVHAMRSPVARLIIRRRTGAEKYRTLVRHVVPLMEKRLPDLLSGREDTITRGAPALILFHADRRAENFRTDLHVALAFGLLAAQSLGLGATAIDLIPPAVERSQTLRELFAIPPANEVVACLILGYPRFRYQRGIRRALKTVTWL